MSDILRILLIGGHGAGDPGACSQFGTESVETRRVLSTVKSGLGNYNCKVDVYPIDRNEYADIRNGVCQVNFSNYDYVFEIHFNSSANASATGTEIWVTYAEGGTGVEQIIVNKLAALGLPNRGVKREDFLVIRTAKNAGASSALVETCFISNQNDMNIYNSKFNSACLAMVEGIAEGFALTKVNNVVLPSPVVPAPAPSKPAYYVRTNTGKQLGAFNNYDGAVSMAKSNSAAVYDIKGVLLVSYFPSSKEYLNLKPHMTSWRVYPTDVAPVAANSCGSLAPSLFGGLSYEILGKPQADVYTIQTASFGRVNIFAPRDDDSTIASYPVY